MKSTKVATTIKIEPALYDEFKVLGIHHKLTLQGLIERCIFRYVNEDAFRNEINNFVVPILPVSTSIADGISVEVTSSVTIQ